MSTRRSRPVPPGWSDPFRDPVLTEYLDSVEKWHGYMRFLGLPHLHENPDEPIARLFVETLAHPRHVRPDEPPDTWTKDRVRVLDLMQKHRRLLLLGDPGSGKSTLLSWVAWNFTRWDGGEWPDRLGPLVPVPFVIRELVIDRKITWDRLCEAFLTHGVARGKLTRDGLDELFGSGQAIVLIDGLDEISNLDVRLALQEAIFAGMRGPAEKCPWLLTSRIVGYDEVPYDGPGADPTGEPSARVEDTAPRYESRDDADAARMSRRWLARVRYSAATAVTRHYVCPFDDRQIDQFAHVWFAARETRGADEAEKLTRNFLRDLREAAAPKALARIPNLLTLFALVYRVHAEIPHGRSVLYDKVAEAYLESIDKSRGFKPRFQRDRMERWLAFVAFHLQRQRAEKKGEEQDREILISKAELLKLLTEDMKAVGGQPSPTEAEEFLDFAARRSGLLLPRGEGQFSFMHLSFQEFFAALFLAKQVMSPKWEKKQSHPGTRRKDLNGYADSSVWTETMVLLFELLKGEPDWTAALRDCLFGERYAMPKRWEKDKSLARAHLLAEILIDPHTGLESGERERDIPQFTLWELRSQQLRVDQASRAWHNETPLARILAPTGYEPERRNQWFVEIVSTNRNQIEFLSLRNCTGVTRLDPLAGLTRLDSLSLYGCTGVTRLDPLAKLTKLKHLWLTSCTGVTRLDPLAGLTDLRLLSIAYCTGVTRLDPLAGLAGLETLLLNKCINLTHLGPLAGLTELTFLALTDCTGLTDLGPLAGLTELKTLHLRGCTGIKEIPPELRRKEVTIISP